MKTIKQLKQDLRALRTQAFWKSIGNALLAIFRSKEARQTAKVALEIIWKDIKEKLAEINIAKRG